MIAKGFEVIDRTHLKSILTEHKLSISGLVDPKTVKKLGQIAGVDAIVTGSVTPFGDSIRVSAKVIATDTAKVIGAAKGDIAKTKPIEELLAKGIETVREVSVPEKPAPPKSSAKAQQRVEARDFIFELQGCKLSGQTVTCSMMVVNKGEDRNIQMGRYYYGCKYNYIRIFDNFGNEYHVSTIQLGNKKHECCVKSLLVSGIPTKVSVGFEGVSQEANMISLFEIINSVGDSEFTVQFRNIPLNR